MLRVPALACLPLLACAAPRLVPPESLPSVPESGGRRTVVLEPFFETTGWQLTTRSEQAEVYGPFTGPQTVTVTREVAEKHALVQINSLASEHARVVEAVKRLRPGWVVGSTASLATATAVEGAPPLTGPTGPVTLVRVVVGEVETVGSNRALKNLACAFGIVLPPLLYLAFTPVEETQRVHGTLSRYEAQAEQLGGRLLRYATQPDYAVDTRGLTEVSRPFGLDVTYREGLFAREDARAPVLIDGFAQRLSAAVVAIVEEGG